MTEDFTAETIKAIRNLYKTDTSAQSLFDWTASRERDASSTSIDRICHILQLSRGDAVALARHLEEAGCGEFVVGRRGQKSRFRWRYSCISLGHAASGETSELEEAENPVPDNEEDVIDAGPGNATETSPLAGITISEAKAALAKSLGVSPSDIEIVVRG